MRMIQSLLLIGCSLGILYLAFMFFSHPEPIGVSMPLLTRETLQENEEHAQQQMQKQQAAALAQKRAELEKKMYKCETDAQCIVVDKDPCGCAKGPKSITAINEDFSLEFSDLIAKKFTGMEMCPDTESHEKECSPSARPACVEKHCKIIY